MGRSWTQAELDELFGVDEEDKARLRQGRLPDRVAQLVKGSPSGPGLGMLVGGGVGALVGFFTSNLGEGWFGVDALIWIASAAGLGMAWVVLRRSDSSTARPRGMETLTVRTEVMDIEVEQGGRFRGDLLSRDGRRLRFLHLSSAEGLAGRFKVYFVDLDEVRPRAERGTQLMALALELV